MILPEECYFVVFEELTWQNDNWMAENQVNVLFRHQVEAELNLADLDLHGQCLALMLSFLFVTCSYINVNKHHFVFFISHFNGKDWVIDSSLDILLWMSTFYWNYLTQWFHHNVIIYHNCFKINPKGFHIFLCVLKLLFIYSECFD